MTERNVTALFATLLLSAAGETAMAQSTPEILIVGDQMPAMLAPLETIASLVPANEIAQRIAAEGTTLIYLGDPASDLSGILAGIPADRPVTLAVNSCGWDTPPDPAALMADMTGDVQVTLATPQQASDCDRAVLDAGFVAAAQLPRHEPALRDGGYRLHDRDPARRPVRITAAGPVVGGLVISAIPVQALPTESTVLVAMSQPPVTTLGTTTGTPLHPGIQPADDQSATPRPGAPEPSIIVGDLAVLMAAGPAGPLGTPFETRETIRQRDPAIFARLLSQGAFDPDEAQVVAAIQTELARMNCYSSRVDGAWGTGSSQALQRFFQVSGAAQAATTPEIGLFRVLVRAEGIRCPDAVVQPVRRGSGSATTGQATARQPSGGGQRNRSSGSSRNTGRGSGSAPAAQQPTNRSGGGIDPGLMGSGIFR